MMPPDFRCRSINSFPPTSRVYCLHCTLNYNTVRLGAAGRSVRIQKNYTGKIKLNIVGLRAAVMTDADGAGLKLSLALPSGGGGGRRGKN